MKKCLSSILVLLLLAGPVCAAADIIYIPMNSFYQQHKSECVASDSIYEAVRETPYYIQPDDEEEPGSGENKFGLTFRGGETVRITHIWNGKWGLLDWDDMWINLDDFRRLFDENDFFRAHGGEYLNASGSLILDEDVPYIEWTKLPEEISEYTAGQRVSGEYSVVLWPFPGSDSYRTRLGSYEYAVGFDTVYRDEAGNLWIRIEGRIYGRTKGWLYLNNFSDTEPPFVTAHYADEAKDDSVPLPAGLIGPQDPGGTQPPLLPLAAAILLSTAAAALLLFMKPKKKPAEAV